MAYNKNDVTSLISKLQGLDLTTAETEVLAEIVGAASDADSEVQGFGSRNEVWKPMIGNLVVQVDSGYSIVFQDGEDFMAKTPGFQDGHDMKH